MKEYSQKKIDFNYFARITFLVRLKEKVTKSKLKTIVTIQMIVYGYIM